MSNVFAGRYFGIVTKCFSTEVLGYQRDANKMYTVFKVLYLTRDDGDQIFYLVDSSTDLLVEQPRIDVPQLEHLRKPE